jgi:hypothetical protein
MTDDQRLKTKDLKIPCPGRCARALGASLMVFYFSPLLYIFVKKISMTTQDIKNKITKAIEEVPESYLPDILSYLNQLKKSTPKNIETIQNFRKILKEDRSLLQKLAK